MKVNDTVILVSFNGQKIPLEEPSDSENYWKLIGLAGKIVQSPLEQGLYASFSEHPRVLVQFPENVQELFSMN